MVVRTTWLNLCLLGLLVIPLKCIYADVPKNAAQREGVPVQVTDETPAIDAVFVPLNESYFLDKTNDSDPEQLKTQTENDGAIIVPINKSYLDFTPPDTDNDVVVEPAEESVVGVEPDLLPENDLESDVCPDDGIAALAEPPHVPVFFSFLDRHQELGSRYISLFVQSVDNFFANSDHIEESTGSFVRLQLESIWTEGRSPTTKGDIKIKARLPKTQKKVKLVFESNPEEQRSALERETRESGPGTATGTDKDTSFYAGLEKDVKQTKWQIKPSIGVRIRSPLDFYVRLRFQRDIEFEKWNVHLYQGFYWFDSSGSGADTTMRWDRPLSHSMLLRFNSYIRYTDINDYFDLTQTVDLVQTFSSRRAITYKIGVLAIHDDQTSYITHYLANALYRWNVHSDYMFLELQPQVLWAKGNNFKSEFSFLFRLEFLYRG